MAFLLFFLCLAVTGTSRSGISFGPNSLSDYNLGQGYALVGSDGGVYTFGTQGFYGSEGGQNLFAPIVGMADTPGSGGYTMTGADGGIFNFGNSQFYGSVYTFGCGDSWACGWGITEGITAVPTNGNYMTVTNTGFLCAYGPNGSVSAFVPPYGFVHGINDGCFADLTSVSDIVGVIPTPDGGGYWMVGSDGGVFAFGDAAFYGSMGGQHLNAPVVGMTARPNGSGYWLVGSDGGIYSFGSAQFYGSPGSTSLPKPMVGIASSPDGGGYWMTASDGAILQYGDAAFDGAVVAGTTLGGPVVGMTR